MLSPGLSIGCLEVLVAEGSSSCFGGLAADAVTTGPIVDVPWVVITVLTSDGAINVF